jgi:chloramphenicol O-acetyltransferase type A
MKRHIDLNTWSRKDHYSFFKDFEIPRFNMTFDLDVTIFYLLTKKQGLKFYYALIHAVIQTLNSIENFGYRIENNRVWHDQIQHVSFTDSIEGTDLFKMVFLHVSDDVAIFQEEAIQASQKQGATLINMATEAILNTVYITSFPWAKFNHFTHATKLGSSDAVPRVSWSQFVEHNGKKTMTISIEVHHGLVDGYHVGQWIQRLQQRLHLVK